MTETTNLDALLERGGEPRISLLRYCVKSVTMEPLFLFLVGEYRLRPSHANAVTLYDVFCAPDAAARVTARRTLPPRNLGLVAVVGSIRQQWLALQSPPVDDEARAFTTTVPHRNLFDSIVAELREDPQGPLTLLAGRYDPVLEPEQNLPGGRMSARQRHFVDNVWRPFVRPRLVAAGFWQIATID